MLVTDEELACLVYNSSYYRLVCLNDVKARLYLPVTIFLSVLIIVGTLGNTTVCLVYWRRRSSRVSSNYFILSLAVLDLVTCVVGMPTEIADLLLPYTFQWPLACKVLRFTHSSTIIASSTILIEVAFDRYYRICHLGRQFTAAKAKLLCLGASFLGIVCAWPTFILFGKKTVTRDLGGVIVTGSDCSTADGMRRTIFPIIYYLFLFSLFGLTITFFAVLYTKIGLAVINRKRVTMVSYASTPSTSHNKNQEKNKNEDTEEGGPNADKCIKVAVNIMDASSSEMSSGHHNDPYNSDDPGEVSRRWPPCAGIQDGTIGRSVSASTILSSLAGSLRRSGKRKSYRVSSGHTRWYATAVQSSERCSGVTGKERDNVRDSVATTKNSLESSDEKSKSDILSRAASLTKVITATHTMNVENYRNRCFTQSDMNMNKEKPNTTSEHRLDTKSQSDRESLYTGVKSELEEGLLESLQKFNFDFNRAFNAEDCCDINATGKLSSKTHNPKLSSGMDKSETRDFTKAIEDKDVNASGGSAVTNSGFVKSSDKETSGLSDLDDSNLSNAGGALKVGIKCPHVNGCSEEFINQLNVYVSNSRSPANRCAKEIKNTQQNQDKLTPARSVCDNTKVELEAKEFDNHIEISLCQPMTNQRHQQQDEEKSKENISRMLSPSAFRRKFSTVFTSGGPLARQLAPSNSRHSQRQVRVGKTTTVLFTVTLAYILSFLPYLTVMVLRSVVKDLEENLSPVGELAYKLCVKSFFINNAINPIIYSFLNQTFRSDARQMFRRMFSTGGAGRRAQVRMLTTLQPASPGP